MLSSFIYGTSSLYEKKIEYDLPGLKKNKKGTKTVIAHVGEESNLMIGHSES